MIRNQPGGGGSQAAAKQQALAKLLQSEEGVALVAAALQGDPEAQQQLAPVMPELQAFLKTKEGQRFLQAVQQQGQGVPKAEFGMKVIDPVTRLERPYEDKRDILRRSADLAADYIVELYKNGGKIVPVEESIRVSLGSTLKSDIQKFQEGGKVLPRPYSVMGW